MTTLNLDVNRPTVKRMSSEIDHHEIFSTQMAELCMSEEFSDVSFEIQDEKIPGHVNILVTRSKYFRALILGEVVASKGKLFNLQVPIEAFKALLKYIYSGHLSLSQMREENILDTLRFVNQCGCTELELSISEYLCEIVSLDNVGAILDTARVLGLETLQNVCHAFLDENAIDFLAHESFKNLTEETLKEIIRRDTFFAPEVQIFTGVNEWCKHNANIAPESVVSLVRLPLLSLKQLFQKVQTSGIVYSDTLLDAINQKTTSNSLPYRKGSWQEKNIATEKFGARVTQGECDSPLLDGDTTSYDLNKSYARHNITDDLNLGIIVKLGLVTLINHIKLRLLDCDERSYSYFVDVSVDKIQWERVVDHRAYHCRSRQFLYFPSRAVRYIKLIGTHSSINKMFDIDSLEAYYMAKIPKMIDGVVAPTVAVVPVKIDAIVGHSHHICSCVSIFTKRLAQPAYYDDNGSIMIHLGQPYVIGSMRFKLYVCHISKFSYYIETSINKKDWEVVVDFDVDFDNRKGFNGSWQDHEFQQRAMFFIKIVLNKSNGKLSNNAEFCVAGFSCQSEA